MNDLSNEVKAKETHEKAIMYSHLTEKNLYMFTMQMKEEFESHGAQLGHKKTLYNVEVID